MKLKLFFAWYDLWIGAYWSKKERTLYICLVPMFGLSIQFGCSDKLWKGIREALEEEFAAKETK